MRTFKKLADSSVPDGFQSHHLIPVGVFASKAFSSAFEAMRLEGFDVRFFPRNGLFLPATELAALRSGLPLHRGPHRRYNELVAYRVEIILRDSGCIKHSASARCDAVERIHHLAGALRAVLYRSDPHMSLNQRDAFQSSVNFDNLDRACDLLWQATK